MTKTISDGLQRAMDGGDRSVERAALAHMCARESKSRKVAARANAGCGWGARGARAEGRCGNSAEDYFYSRWRLRGRREAGAPRSAPTTHSRIYLLLVLLRNR